MEQPTVWMWVAILSLRCGHICALPSVEIAAVAELQNVWSWQTGADPANACLWAGVGCRSSHITLLDLTLHGLQGPLPTALCNLTQLNSLLLGANRLSGRIPECIGTDLTHLIILVLGVNNLTGPLPSSLGRNTSMLRKLDLEQNPLNCEFPNSTDAWFGADSQLTWLYMNQAGMRGVLPRIDNSQLVAVDLQHNDLVGAIPSFAASAAQLQTLQLGYNGFTSLGDELYLSALSQLTLLDIANNKIQQPLPRFLPPKLVTLSAAFNHFHGPLPSTWEVDSLSCRGCTIRSVDLSSNDLSGVLPAWVWDYPQLTMLKLANNSFVGNLTKYSPFYGPLIYVDLSSNAMSGAPDSTFCHWPQLTLLRLNGNAEMGRTTDAVLSLPSCFVANGVAVPAAGAPYSCDLLSIDGDPTRSLSLDASFGNYGLCKCVPGYVGVPPSACRPCLASGDCSTQGIMKLPIGVYPLPVPLLPASGPTTLTVSVLAQCPRSGSWSACNPSGAMFINASGVFDTEGNSWPRFCADGFSDRLCSRCTCTDGNDCYFADSGDCVHCTAFPVWQTALQVCFAAASVVAVSLFPAYAKPIVAAMVVVAIVLSAVQIGNTWFMQMLFLFILAMLGNSDAVGSGVVKSLIFFGQTALAIAAASSGWPQWLSLGASHGSVLSVHTSGLPCWSSAFSTSSNADLNLLVMRVVVGPAVLAIIMVVCGALRYFRPGQSRGSAHGQRRQSELLGAAAQAFHESRVPLQFWCFRALLFTAYTQYFDLASLCIGVFSCAAIDGDVGTYVSGQPWIACSSTEWRDMAAVAGVFGALFVVGTPLLFAGLLRHRKDSANLAETRVLMNFLFESFEHHVRADSQIGYYWEVLMLLRRLAIALVLSLLPNSPIAQSNILVLVLLVALVLQFYVTPYRSAIENRMEQAVLCALLVLAVCGFQLTILPASSDLYDVHQLRAYLESAIIVVALLPVSLAAVWAYKSSRAPKPLTLSSDVASMQPLAADHSNFASC